MCACSNVLGSPEQEKEFAALLEKNLGNSGNIMEVLQKTQGIYGFIPKPAVKRIAESLKVSENKIYGIITFYSQFTLTPKAKYNIDICLGTACFVLGANDVYEHILQKLNLKPGQTSDDGKWIVTSCRCIGCCGIAPAMTINGEVYGKLTIEKGDEILAKYDKE